MKRTKFIGLLSHMEAILQAPTYPEIGTIVSTAVDFNEDPAAQRDEPTYNIFYSAGGDFQSRVGITTAMLALQGYDVPGEVTVPHVMGEVTADDCDPDRPNPAVSGTSLVSGDVLALMYGG
ncbi:MAG: hypothetical protein ACLFWH_00765 [Actinomycetota bacterium]